MNIFTKISDVIKELFGTEKYECGCDNCQCETGKLEMINDGKYQDTDYEEIIFGDDSEVLPK